MKRLRAPNMLPFRHNGFRCTLDLCLSYSYMVLLSEYSVEYATCLKLIEYIFCTKTLFHAEPRSTNLLRESYSDNSFLRYAIIPMAKGKKRRREIDLPEGCFHYSDLMDVPWDIQKYFCLKSVILMLTRPRYYHQRYKIFSNYDQGIWMTDDAWFGVTPEPVALYVHLLSFNINLSH